MYAVDIPQHAARPIAAKRLVEAASQGSLEGSPDALELADIHEAPNVFQPRFDSIAYAPGRSEAHVAELASVLSRGTALDPVAVVSFGHRWFAIDGHHRLAAYRASGWAKAIPVHALQPEATGADRVAWAVRQSVALNAKAKLNMSAADKADAAWREVASRTPLSKAELRTTFGVSDGAVGNMRRVERGLRDRGLQPAHYHSWSGARRELARAGSAAGNQPVDFSERQRRIAAMKLQPLMALRLAPNQLAEALEAFSPGIVMAMAEAQQHDPLGEI